jgi:ferrous iron transport protein A
MTVSLDELKDGQSAVVREIGGGQGIRQRLASLGVHPGDTLRVRRSAHYRGPVLIEVSGAEVAIGKGMAHGILVETAIPPCASP